VNSSNEEKEKEKFGLPMYSRRETIALTSASNPVHTRED